MFLNIFSSNFIERLVILFDEMQAFATTINATSRNEYPQTLTNYNDALLSSLFELIQTLVVKGRLNGIYFCLAGSTPTLKNLMILSPCKIDPEFQNSLPLPLFSPDDVVKVRSDLIFFGHNKIFFFLKNEIGHKTPF